MICAPSGEVLHETRALTRTLDDDPDGEQLRSHMRLLAGALGRVLQEDPAPPTDLTDVPCKTHRTQTVLYRLQVGCITLGQPDCTQMIIVTLERPTAEWPSEEATQSSFELTPQEARVALLLAKGQSNEEIADELYISSHTARHHTEAVFGKLNIHSRSEVAAALLDL